MRFLVLLSAALTLSLQAQTPAPAAPKWSKLKSATPAGFTLKTVLVEAQSGAQCRTHRLRP